MNDKRDSNILLIVIMPTETFTYNYLIQPMRMPYDASEPYFDLLMIRRKKYSFTLVADPLWRLASQNEVVPSTTYQLFTNQALIKTVNHQSKDSRLFFEPLKTLPSRGRVKARYYHKTITRERSAPNSYKRPHR